jgi:hypothetical protein
VPDGFFELLASSATAEFGTDRRVLRRRCWFPSSSSVFASRTAEFKVQVLPADVGWATIVAAFSMFGVAKHHGRWMCEGSGSWMRWQSSPVTSCELEGRMDLCVISFLSRVAFAKAWVRL